MLPSLAALTLRTDVNLEFSDVYEARKYDQVEADLLKGKDPNWEFSETTELLEAVSRGYARVVKLLLEHGADPNHEDRWGNTALINATSVGHDAIVELLLKQGADTERFGEREMTALMIAAEKSYIRIVILLLGHGANPEIQNWGHKSAADFTDDYEIMDLLTNPEHIERLRSMFETTLLTSLS